MERPQCGLEGPHRVTPEEIAATFANLLDRPVRTDAVPRETWESLFQSQGMKNPAPRIQMLDGFNEGWIEFEGGEAGSRKGKSSCEPCFNGLSNARAGLERSREVSPIAKSINFNWTCS